MLALLLALCIGLITEPLPTQSDTIYTVILEGGTIYDGTGKAPFVADVGLIGDRIAAIGDLKEARAALRLNVDGLAVAPGFIDIHSHAVRGGPETSGIFRQPLAENYIRQGVTTVFAGQDGSSPLPIGEFLARFELTPAAINLGLFVGHGSVRRAVMGNENRDPTPEELEQMKALVAQAMEEGAWGLSSGLKYVPGAYARTEEVIELARVAARYGGIYITHMRDEGLHVLESVKETIRIGREGGLPAQITHAKIIGPRMWGKSREMLRLVDEALQAGVDVSMDQYPYTASSTGISVLFPAWALEGSREDIVARLQDPEARARIKEAVIFNLREDRGGGDPSRVQLAFCRWDTTLNGKNLAQVLREQGRPVTVEEAAELVLEIQEQGGCTGIFHAMSEEDVERIMQHPRTMICSDGGIPDPGVGVPHPRNYGAFARVLARYVRERRILTPEMAIHKMTGLPAWRLNLKDRGVLRPGAYADVVVLDLNRVQDRATFTDPHRYAEGVVHVFVNGQAVLLDGKLTGARPGRALRKGRDG
ncbi:N-acyl-D-amino-acid deacylase family protein [Rhodothermus marinus]|uniref:N-acyl-D-amino-acid deacylase n=1 Tax=Rhodothermus marinus (strain ATCC 43812 / DSM 4252 / R-10) TaxID=518766 RepID=D0MID9_RHOM4|nr:D-aminoacylase [Rhodothermus marinus]ACY48247.1 N-acyl-D-amino-acid deacylase [Rhodothermus marinus DSM 4252]